jgi:hypothetical protein
MNEGSHTAAARQRLKKGPAFACFELSCARFLPERSLSGLPTRTEVRGFAPPSSYARKGRTGEHQDEDGRNDRHATHGISQLDAPA